jgi:ankyrin repeat protein
VVEILLRAGADVNDRDVDVCDGDVWDTTQMDMQYSLCRLTSLHFSWFSCVLFCSVLVLVFHVHFHVHQYVNVSSAYHVIIYQGWTALHIACDDGYTEIALLLVSYGADATIKDYVRPID